MGLTQGLRELWPKDGSGICVALEAKGHLWAGFLSRQTKEIEGFAWGGFGELVAESIIAKATEGLHSPERKNLILFLVGVGGGAGE